MSEQRRRRTVVFWLVAVVVIVAGGSWIVTGGIGRQGTPLSTRASPSTPIPPPTLIPPPTPAFADCGADIQLFGAFNDCASIDRTAADDCTIAADTLYAVFKLDGTSHDWYLSLDIPRTYPEPGDYALADGGAEIDVTNEATGAVWRSVSGVVTTATPDSRSGTITAILQAAVVNQTPAPGPTLSVNGSWRC